MWEVLLNLINNDTTISGIIASFLGNTLSTPVSEGLKKLFKKKQENKTLTKEDCEMVGIKEKDLKAILDEIKLLKFRRSSFVQHNEEGSNRFERRSLNGDNMDVLQVNKKGDNSIIL